MFYLPPTGIIRSKLHTSIEYSSLFELYNLQAACHFGQLHFVLSHNDLALCYIQFSQFTFNLFYLHFTQFLVLITCSHT